MIYKIAEPPENGRGLIGIYPEWGNTGKDDAYILARTRNRYFSILFTRNYFSHFFERISKHMKCYQGQVDIVCGWEVEKIRMFLLAYNPAVEVFPLSAMHFNTFELLQKIHQKVVDGQIVKENDLFFAVSARPDHLKNARLLVKLLAGSRRPIKVSGYGRMSEADLAKISSNTKLDFTWRGKASLKDSEQRESFLSDLARSRVLLVTSRAEGYSRLIGEALYVGVPVLLFADIQCENWVHLNSSNCRLFLESTYEACLGEMLGRRWEFPQPDLVDGNQLLKTYFNKYLKHRGLPKPATWYHLRYGALTDEIIRKETL